MPKFPKVSVPRVRFAFFIPRFLSGLTVLAGFLTALPADAHWNTQARSQFNRLERAVSQYGNDELGGIRGAAAVELGSLFRSFHFRKWHVRDPANFNSTGNPIELVVSRTGRKVSPLVVFFPGIFGDARSGGSLMVGRQARRARNHTLLLPNPWGSQFQSAYPKFMPGNFEREAQTMVGLISEGIRRIGPERISGIHFVGESYGGFLGAMTARYALESGAFTVESVLSISVPFHIGNAIGALDELADRHRSAYFERGCDPSTQNWTRLVGFMFELVSRPAASDELYGEGETLCSGPIFTYLGFQQPLFHLAKTLHERAPSAEWERRPESEWMERLRFRDFGDIFFERDLDEIVSEDSATLQYWVEKLRAQGVTTLALVAKNDPLNPPPGVGSDNVIDAYPPNDILVLRSGGHLGFRGEPAYRKLLRKQLRAPATAIAIENASDESFDQDLDNDSAPADDGMGED